MTKASEKLRILYVGIQGNPPISIDTEYTGILTEIEHCHQEDRVRVLALHKILESKGHSPKGAHLAGLSGLSFAILIREILDRKPHILHFSGHCTDEGEFLLGVSRGNEQRLTLNDFDDSFAQLKDFVHLAVFNACWTRPVAETVVKHIDCAIGFPSEIDNRAAQLFSTNFYRQLGENDSVEDACKLAGMVIKKDLGAPQPRLLSRTGVAPDQLRLLERIRRQPIELDKVEPSPFPDDGSRWPYGRIGVLVIAAVLLLFFGFCPPLSMQRQSLGSDVVIASRWLSTRPASKAANSLYERLSGLDKKAVRRVNLALYGADAADLKQQASDAGASVVIDIDRNAQADITALRDSPTAAVARLLLRMPPIVLADQETIDQLAKIVYLAIRLGDEGVRRRLVGPEFRLARAKNAALAGAWLSLRHLVAPSFQLTPHDRDALIEFGKKCDDIEQTPATWPCLLADYMCVRDPDTPAQERENATTRLRKSDLPGLGDFLDVLWARDHYRLQPDRARQILSQVADRLLPCDQLELVAAAATLVVEFEHTDDKRLIELAHLPVATVEQCDGDKRREVLTVRAATYIAAARWKNARADYAAAARLGDLGPEYVFQWVVAQLRQEVDRARVIAVIVDKLQPQTLYDEIGMAGDLLLWVLERNRDSAMRLRARFPEIDLASVSSDMFRLLRPTLCSPQHTDQDCMLFEILTGPRTATAQRLFDAILPPL
ncbi:MAG: CHAT domain-containing protein [Proteobacteria bacterium]|nr:CHAT domain-containing protein [Pseudomonadota bacterium]